MIAPDIEAEALALAEGEAELEKLAAAIELLRQLRDEGITETNPRELAKIAKAAQAVVSVAAGVRLGALRDLGFVLKAAKG